MSASATSLNDKQSSAWVEYELFYIDRYFNLVNRGLYRIFADLNGHKFLLTIFPEEVERGENVFLIPQYDTLIFDIQPYLYPDSFDSSANYIRLLWQGPYGTDAMVIIGDRRLDNLELDFVLHLQELPQQIIASQNYPNPFNEITHIKYTIPERLLFGTRVRLEIYNILGQRIRTLVEGTHFPGEFVAQWDGRNEFGTRVSSGVYFYRLEIGPAQIVKRMVLVK